MDFNSLSRLQAFLKIVLFICLKKAGVQRIRIQVYLSLLLDYGSPLIDFLHTNTDL